MRWMSWWLMEDLCASCPELSDGMQAATEAPRFIFNSDNLLSHSACPALCSKTRCCCCCC